MINIIMISDKDKEFALWMLDQGFKKEQIKPVLLKKGYSEEDVEDFLNPLVVPTRKTHREWRFLISVIVVVLLSSFAFYVLLWNNQSQQVASNIHDLTTIPESELNQKTNVTESEPLKPFEISVLDCFKNGEKYTLVLRSSEDYRNVSLYDNGSLIGKYDFTKNTLVKINFSSPPENLLFSLPRYANITRGVTCG